MQQPHPPLNAPEAPTLEDPTDPLQETLAISALITASTQKFARLLQESESSRPPGRTAVADYLAKVREPGYPAALGFEQPEAERHSLVIEAATLRERIRQRQTYYGEPVDDATITTKFAFELRQLSDVEKNILVVEDVAAVLGGTNWETMYANMDGEPDRLTVRPRPAEMSDLMTTIGQTQRLGPKMPAPPERTFAIVEENGIRTTTLVHDPLFISVAKSFQTASERFWASRQPWLDDLLTEHAPNLRHSEDFYREYVEAVVKAEFGKSQLIIVQATKDEVAWQPWVDGLVRATNLHNKNKDETTPPVTLIFQDRNPDPSNGNSEILRRINPQTAFGQAA